MSVDIVFTRGHSATFQEAPYTAHILVSHNGGDGSNHNGEAATKQEALLLAVLHWARYEKMDYRKMVQEALIDLQINQP